MLQPHFLQDPDSSGEMGKKRGETALPVDMPASGSALGRVPRTVGAKRPPSESPGRQADSHPKELLQEGLRMPMEPPSHLPPRSTRQGWGPSAHSEARRLLLEPEGRNFWRVRGCCCMALERASLSREYRGERPGAS